MHILSVCTVSVQVTGEEACVDVRTPGKLFCDDFYEGTEANVTRMAAAEALPITLELALGVPAAMLLLLLCLFDFMTERRMHKTLQSIARWVQFRLDYERKRRLQNKVVVDLL